mgnify:CR=1 FL=1
MKRLISFLLFVIVVFAIACKPKYIETNAKIVERSFITDSTIKLKFAYNVSNKEIVDSIVVKNFNIISDTISLTYLIDNPLKNEIKIP